jgi:chromosome segregation ATPase
MSVTRTTTTPTALTPVNQAVRQLSIGENNNQDFALINQALGQLTVEGLRNQNQTIDNISSLFNAVQALQALVQSQASELLLIKEQLRTADQQKQETARTFEAYKNTSNAAMQAQATRIEMQVESIEKQADALRNANVQIQQLRANLVTLSNRPIPIYQMPFIPGCGPNK